jgi:hypothetical protein
MKRNKIFFMGMLVIVFIFGFVPCAFAQTYTDSEARSILSGIGVFVNKPEPGTSLRGIRHKTLTEIIDLRQAYGATITITGGTESGHTSGTYSHANGYKLDLRIGTGLDDFIRRNFTKQQAYSPYSELYKSPSGALYGLEGNHWDVLVR